MIAHLGFIHNNEQGPTEPQFIYRGHAVGAAGDLFPVRAASSLPVIGGRSHGSAPAFPDPDNDCNPEISQMVSWGSVATSASGFFNRQTKAFETLVTATATDIRLNEVFEIANLSAVLESSHPFSRKAGQETAIATPEKGIQIFGLRIFGWPVQVILNERFLQVNSSSSFREMVASREGESREYARQIEHQPYQDQGYFTYSLVGYTGWRKGQEPPEEIRERVAFEGHVIQVRDVGAFYLGEVLRNNGSCRLILLRARLEMDDGEETSLRMRRGKKMLSFEATESREPLRRERKEMSVAFAEVESNGLGPPPD